MATAKKAGVKTKPVKYNSRIHKLEIQNFKSIRDLKLDCKRVNVFIGKPNVGKSNILEALGLFSTPYNTNTKDFFGDYLRYDKFHDLFFDKNVKNTIEIKTDIFSAQVRNLFQDNFSFIISESKSFKTISDSLHSDRSINDQLPRLRELWNKTIPYFFYGFFNGNSKELQSSSLGPSYDGLVKKYDFISLKKHEGRFELFLLPPHGPNLWSTLVLDKTLLEIIGAIFSTYGLAFTYRTVEKEFELYKREGIYSTAFPLYLGSDTLNRLIFYLSAIKSNNDSIIVFEEPEAHSFPPFTKMIADFITMDKNNQYFISTHSPYLLSALIAETDVDEIAIHHVDFKNHQSVARTLTKKETVSIVDNHMDVFFNLDQFSI